LAVSKGLVKQTAIAGARAEMVKVSTGPNFLLFPLDGYAKDIEDFQTFLSSDSKKSF
jgi:hypothetical protein